MAAEQLGANTPDSVVDTRQQAPSHELSSGANTLPPSEDQAFGPLGTINDARRSTFVDDRLGEDEQISGREHHLLAAGTNTLDSVTGAGRHDPYREPSQHLPTPVDNHLVVDEPLGSLIAHQNLVGRSMDAEIGPRGEQTGISSVQVGLQHHLSHQGHHVLNRTRTATRAASNQHDNRFISAHRTPLSRTTSEPYPETVASRFQDQTSYLVPSSNRSFTASFGGGHPLMGAIDERMERRTDDQEIHLDGPMLAVDMPSNGHIWAAPLSSRPCSTQGQQDVPGDTLHSKSTRLPHCPASDVAGSATGHPAASGPLLLQSQELIGAGFQSNPIYVPPPTTSNLSDLTDGQLRASPHVFHPQPRRLIQQDNWTFELSSELVSDSFYSPEFHHHFFPRL